MDPKSGRRPAGEEDEKPVGMTSPRAHMALPSVGSHVAARPRLHLAALTKNCCVNLGRARLSPPLAPIQTPRPTGILAVVVVVDRFVAPSGPLRAPQPSHACTPRWRLPTALIILF
jgi:hypothetical protein